MYKLIPRCSSPLNRMPTVVPPNGTQCVLLVEVCPSSHPGNLQKRYYGRRRGSDDEQSSQSFFSRATGGFLGSSKPADLSKIYTEKRLMGYKMEQMFDVVMDVGAYQNFLPWCQKSVILSEGHNKMLAEMTIGIPPLTERYTSKVIWKRPFHIRAVSDNGRLFNHLVNDWKFSPGVKNEPSSCIVDFSVSFEFKSALQAKLGNVFFDETARAMTAAFYQEAQKRYGKESLPSVKIQIIPKEDFVNYH